MSKSAEPADTGGSYAADESFWHSEPREVEEVSSPGNWVGDDTGYRESVYDEGLENLEDMDLDEVLSAEGRAMLSDMGFEESYASDVHESAETPSLTGGEPVDYQELFEPDYTLGDLGFGETEVSKPEPVETEGNRVGQV